MIGEKANEIHTKQPKKEEGDFLMKKQIAIMLSLTMLLTACSSVAGNTTTAAPAQNNTGTSEHTSVESKPDVVWPTGDITVVVAAAAGGGTDLQARIIAEYFKRHTGYNMFVENQNGGSGTVAYEQVRNAKIDGSKLLYYHSSLFTAYYSGIYNYEPLENFTPLATFLKGTGNCLCVPASSPYNTLDDLVEAAKAAPDTILAGIQVGGFPEYLIRMLEDEGDCTFRKVDTGNEADRLTSLLGGHIKLAVISERNSEAYENSGDLKVLAILNDKPVDIYPQWTPVGETQYPNLVIPDAHIFYVPKGVDENLARAMNQVFLEIAQDPDYLETCKKNKIIIEARDYDEVQKYAAGMDENIKNLLTALTDE